MGNNEGTVADTLKQRGLVYGSYKEVCEVRAKILDLLSKHHVAVTGKPMDDRTLLGFSDVVLKLVRAAGKPEYEDSWHDLAGYATLMEDIAKSGKTLKDALAISDLSKAFEGGTK
jgi:hypothetical protein